MTSRPRFIELYCRYLRFCLRAVKRLVIFFMQLERHERKPQQDRSRCRRGPFRTGRTRRADRARPSAIATTTSTPISSIGPAREVDAGGPACPAWCWQPASPNAISRNSKAGSATFRSCCCAGGRRDRDPRGSGRRSGADAAGLDAHRELLRKASPRSSPVMKAMLAGQPVERAQHRPCRSGSRSSDRLARRRQIDARPDGGGKSSAGVSSSSTRRSSAEAGYSITEIFSIYGRRLSTLRAGGAGAHHRRARRDGGRHRRQHRLRPGDLRAAARQFLHRLDQGQPGRAHEPRAQSRATQRPMIG